MLLKILYRTFLFCADPVLIVIGRISYVFGGSMVGNKFAMKSGIRLLCVSSLFFFGFMGYSQDSSALQTLRERVSRIENQQYQHGRDLNSIQVNLAGVQAQLSIVADTQKENTQIQKWIFFELLFVLLAIVGFFLKPYVSNSSRPNSILSS